MVTGESDIPIPTVQPTSMRLFIHIHLKPREARKNLKPHSMNDGRQYDGRKNGLPFKDHVRICIGNAYGKWDAHKVT